MKVTKTAGLNIKLECECGRKFWYVPGSKPATCPACKTEWIETNYFAAFLKMNEAEYDLVASSAAKDITEFIAFFFTATAGLPFNSTIKGLKFEKITETQFKEYRDLITKNNIDYLSNMYVNSIFKKGF